jgi:cytochrome c biogenesis protein CcmG, thiol:disulfide interchange protein DsbE
MTVIPPNDTNDTETKKNLPVPIYIVAGILLVGFLGFLFMGLQRSQQGPVKVGQELPGITLTTFDGKTIDTTSEKGKVILINFWSSWCKPCESEADALQSSWEYYQPGNDVLFVGVDYVDTEPEAKATLAKFGTTYPNGPDLGTKISQMFRIRGVPETYIVDRDGKLAYIQIGPFNSSSEIKNLIDPLLGSN